MYRVTAYSSGRVVVCLWLLAFWDYGFEYRRGYGCLSVVSVVCCQIEISATRCSLVQRSPTDCGVSECHHETSTMRRPCVTRGCVTRGSSARENKCTVTVPSEYVTRSEILIVDFLIKIVYRLYWLARGSVFLISVFAQFISRKTWE
jgi:hypothetical protein